MLTYVSVVLVIGGGRDSAVVIATCYGLYGLGIEFPWGLDFSYPSIPAPRPTELPVRRVLSLFTGGQADGTWRLPPTIISSDGVDKGGGIPPSLICALMACCRVNFTFY